MNAFTDVVRVLYEPEAVFGRVSEKPSFWQPFVVIAVVFVLVQALTLPYAAVALEPMYQRMAQQNPQAADTARRLAWIGLVVAPIILAVILLINALILWVLVSLVGGEGKFGTLLSVSTYAAVTFCLVQIVSIVILMVKGKEGISTMQDLQPGIGLDLLLPGGGLFTQTLLRSVNPFTIWGVVITATGIRVTHKTSKGAAYTVAIIGAVLGILVGAVLAATCGRRAG
jgi:membrane protein, antimicrobial resistance system